MADKFSDKDTDLSEYSAEEWELIARIEKATRHPLPASLEARLEREIAEPRFRPQPLAWVRWSAAAAVLVLVAGAVLLATLVLNNNTVTAQEVEKKVEQASQKYSLPGYIRYREYTMTDTVEGLNDESKPVTISFPVKYEDWSLIGEGGILDKVKSAESATVKNADPPEEYSYRQVSLYDSAAKRTQIYIDPPGNIVEVKGNDIKYSVNELDTREQFLKNPRQNIYAGTANYTQVVLLEADPDTYLLRYSFEAEQKLDGVNIKSTGKVEFRISKKNYEVVGYLYNLSYVTPEGAKINYTRDARITNSQFLAPDPARSKEVFQLGAPPGTPIEQG